MTPRIQPLPHPPSSPFSCLLALRKKRPLITHSVFSFSQMCQRCSHPAFSFSLMCTVRMCVCVFFSPISSTLPHFLPLASNEPERRLIIVITAVIVVSLSLSFLLFPDCDGDVTHWAERKEDIQGKKRDTNDTRRGFAHDFCHLIFSPAKAVYFRSNKAEKEKVPKKVSLRFTNKS